MKIPSPTSSESILQELIAWSELAHDALNSSTRPWETTGLRSLKQQLIRQHARHLAQLREWTGSRKSNATWINTRIGAWSQVISAMSAKDEHVSLAACSLLERAVFAAYFRAAEQLEAEAGAWRLVTRHKQELESCRDLHLRNRPTWRDRAASPVETNSAFGSPVAVAS